MSTRFPYDSAYDPPAPSCPIVLSTATGDSSLPLTAIIDSGADATIVPLHHLKVLGAKRAFAASLRSQWGERRKVFLYFVDVRIAQLTLPGVYVVGDEQGNEVVLGRNVLNRLRLLLDGPALTAALVEDDSSSS